MGLRCSAADPRALLRYFGSCRVVGFRVQTSTFEGIIVQIFIFMVLRESYDWLINYFYATINLSSRTMQFSVTVKGVIVFFGPACCEVSSDFLEELKT